MKVFYFSLWTFLLLSVSADAAECDHGWVMYKDELCIKMFNTYVGYEEAKNICAAQANEMATSSLVMVKESGMQQFLATYTQGNFDNLWLGGKYDKQTSQFRWVDGEPLTYSHWQDDYPRNFTEADTCIELKPVNSKRANNSGGSWSNVLCQKRNQVMCQKTVSWTFDDLVAEMMKIRKELSETQTDLSAAQRDLSTTRSDLSATRSDLSATRSDLSETRSDLAATRANLTATQEELRIKGLEIVRTQQDLVSVTSRVVPIGSIYIEYNSQSSPRTLWPTLTWQDITSTYAGLFFRASGSGSAGWGSIQTECSPRITTVQHGHSTSTEFPSPVVIPANGWSPYFRLGSNDMGTGTRWYEGLRMNTVGCEVRPRNQAIRIWKRTG